MGIANDVRLGARLLLKDRWFTLAAVFTLALGIAATNTVFTIVNATLFRPIPVVESERLVDLGQASYLDLQDWRNEARSFEGLAAMDERSTSLADDSRVAEAFIGGYVTSNTFTVVRQRPLLGRDFTSDDERPGAPAVVILGHRVWTTRYNADPAIVGRTVRVDGVPTTVIGVMPAGFGFPQISELWLPASRLTPAALNNRGAEFFSAIGRLRPGVLYANAQSELAVIAERLDGLYPETASRPPQVVQFRSGIDAGTPAAMIFLLMLGAVTFVLLIACANVANLLLARAAVRSREVSLRVSLGASRWQIVRQLLAESLMLAAAAGVLALLLSRAGSTALWQVIVDSGQGPPYWLDFSMDWRVFIALVGACGMAAVLSGLAPAWVTSKANLVELFTEGARGVSGTRAGRRWSGAFVVGQLALAIVLLSGAGVMLRSLMLQASTRSGIDLSDAIVARVDLPDARYPTTEQRAAFFRQLEEGADAPGLRVTYASAVPLAGAPERRLATDRRRNAEGDGPAVGQMTVGTLYFEMMGLPIRGRGIQSGTPDAARVVVVNQRLAEMHFPGEDPIGRQLKLVTPGTPAAASEWLTVVGIVPNVRQRSTEGGAFDPLAYIAVDANPATRATLIARSPLDAGSAATALRRQVAAIDPDLPLFEVATAAQRVVNTRWEQRFAGSIFTIVAAIALLLALVGLYAVTAYAASQRTKELGVRRALGAQSRDLWWTVVHRAASHVAIGLVLGLGGGIAIARVLPSRLTGTVGNDPVTFAAVCVLLVLTALIASSLPARRAIRLDPATALRSE